MSQDDFPAQLRVGHVERDAVAAILQEAAADGRLEMDELDQRLGVALQAKTYADLTPLVADLSADLPWQPGRVPSVPSVTAQTPAPGYARGDPLRLDGGVSTEKRDGVWVIPPFVRISSGMGSVRLNCLQASTATPIVELEVVAGAGSVAIVLPDGWAANDDRLGKALGSKSIKVSRAPAPGQPLFVLFGSVGMGSFTVRYASRGELRRLDRRR